VSGVAALWFFGQALTQSWRAWKYPATWVRHDAIWDIQRRNRTANSFKLLWWLLSSSILLFLNVIHSIIQNSIISTLLEKIATNRMHPRSLLQTLTSGTIIGPLQLHGNKCIRNWWRISTKILHRLFPFLFHDTHISSPSVASHSTLLLYTRIQYLHRMIVFLIRGLKDKILLRSFQITHPSSHCNQGTGSTRRSSLSGPGSTAGVVENWMICEFRPISSPLWWFICIGPVALMEWSKFGWFESSLVALSYWCFASFLPAVRCYWGIIFALDIFSTMVRKHSRKTMPSCIEVLIFLHLYE
jgi:hypothetical protein